MPQRFLRPAITNSERWNSVSFAAQSVYVRLLTRVDDFGQFDGRPSVILGQCLSVWNDLHPKEAVNLQQLKELLQQLAAISLIELFKGSNGKVYLQVTQWEERIRVGCVPKWREDDVDYVKWEPTAASCSNLLPPTPTPTPTPTSTPNASVAAGAATRGSRKRYSMQAAPIPPELDTLEFKAVWEKRREHRRQMKKPMTTFAQELQLKELAKWGVAKSIKALELAIGNDWQGVFDPDERRGQRNGSHAPEPNQMQETIKIKTL
jgi:hypothetical protein